MYRQTAEWTSSLFSVNNSYIRPKVIIEVSGRSMSEPVQTVSLHSYIDDVFKNAPFTELDFTVRAVVPERTFLEKLFLLHEEYHKPSADVRTSRMSRHLYDICQIMETPISERALNDKILYLSVMEHRGGFIGLRGFDYSTLLPQTLNIIHPSEIMERWRQDYREMQNSMIYGDSPSYDDLISKLRSLNDEINRHNY